MNYRFIIISICFSLYVFDAWAQIRTTSPEQIRRNVENAVARQIAEQRAKKAKEQAERERIENAKHQDRQLSQEQVRHLKEDVRTEDQMNQLMNEELQKVQQQPLSANKGQRTLSSQEGVATYNHRSRDEQMKEAKARNAAKKSNSTVPNSLKPVTEIQGVTLEDYKAYQKRWQIKEFKPIDRPSTSSGYSNRMVKPKRWMADDEYKSKFQQSPSYISATQQERQAQQPQIGFSPQQQATTTQPQNQTPSQESIISGNSQPIPMNNSTTNPTPLPTPTKKAASNQAQKQVEVLNGNNYVSATTKPYAQPTTNLTNNPQHQHNQKTPQQTSGSLRGDDAKKEIMAALQHANLSSLNSKDVFLNGPINVRKIRQVSMNAFMEVGNPATIVAAFPDGRTSTIEATNDFFRHTR